MKVMSNYCEMNTTEIKGNAFLCFEESGVRFQGAIQAKDGTQYAVYGTKSGKYTRRRSHAVTENKDSGQHELCGCQDELEGPGVPVTYDIKIVDCEVGEEYNLQRVHGRNGNMVTMRCKCVNFNTSQIYRGQKADMEAQKIMGQKLVGNGIVYEGPIEVTAQSLQRERPWVL